MYLYPRMEQLAEKKLVGQRIRMSLAENKTADLWRNFMPRRNEIDNKMNADLISMQVYSQSMKMGDFNQEFDKWAAVEVPNFDAIPNEMETFTLEAGDYAVFDYKGLSTDSSIFIYIFTNWLPKSEYSLDDRPHFEILGEKYKNGDTNSEEEIWIPIKK